ncbi:MAG: FxsA family protein [Actinomycetota bacterium]
MGLLLFILLLAIPIAELYVIVQVGDLIGLPLTLLLLIGVSVLGTVLLKREGSATYFKARDVLARGGVPSKELTDGFLILLGGALLLTPGFLTDIVGLVLILPFTRAPLKRFFTTVIFAKLARRNPTMAGGVYTARVVRERRAGSEKSRTSPSGTSSPPRIAQPEHRVEGDDGSPDRE